jgi:dTDP-4-amino-4,6-dideoxygalactose transaminase
VNVPFLHPAITERDIQQVVRVLRSGWLLLSRETTLFEEEFAAYMGGGAREAILTNSCTSAIQMALVLAGVGPGDEVITTPLSYVATANPILHCGATPVFVDVEPDSGLIDLRLVEQAITRKTRVILPVHLYGQMVDMKRLKRIARRGAGGNGNGRDITLIEDAAHAIESRRDGISPSQLSRAACFSFHTSKNITAGQAGALLVNDHHDGELGRILRRDGVKNIGVKRRMIALGFKSLATEFVAALLRSQLKRIDAQWKTRKRLYDRYAAALRCMGVAFNPVLPGSRHAYHMIVIWVEPTRRDAISERLSDAGIGTSIHYDPIHLEPYYRERFGYKPGDFPIAERLGHSTITLPMHPLLTAKEQSYVIATLEKIFGCATHRGQKRPRRREGAKIAAKR